MANSTNFWDKYAEGMDYIHAPYYSIMEMADLSKKKKTKDKYYYVKRLEDQRKKWKTYCLTLHHSNIVEDCAYFSILPVFVYFLYEGVISSALWGLWEAQNFSFYIRVIPSLIASFIGGIISILATGGFMRFCLRIQNISTETSNIITMGAFLSGALLTSYLVYLLYKKMNPETAEKYADDVYSASLMPICCILLYLPLVLLRFMSFCAAFLGGAIVESITLWVLSIPMVCLGIFISLYYGRYKDKEKKEQQRGFFVNLKDDVINMFKAKQKKKK